MLAEQPPLELSEQEKAQRELEHTLALIEAALYVSGRPLEPKTLGSVIRIRSKTKILELARMLVEKYRQTSGALEILELEDGRFALQLRPEYVPRVRRLATRPLLTPGPLKTLSYIAYRQPVTQAQVIAIRGPQAYNHVKELEQMGLITCDKLGRTKVVRTTEYFADYFNLSHDLRLLKRQLQALFETTEKLKETKP
jgi:segregation and condensation protein B